MPVRVILDDFANQAPIPNFETIIAAVRSRDIWITLICQATAQLEARYGAAAQTIIGCCDTVLYLGVNDIKTARELSERADMPVSEVQALPIGQVMIFRRGSACRIAQRFSAGQHVNGKWLESRKRKEREAKREEEQRMLHKLDDALAKLALFADGGEDRNLAETIGGWCGGSGEN